MVGSGAFGARDRFHLINGYLVEKMTQNPPHSTADDLCGDALARAIPAGWYVRAAKPVRLPPDSMPEPDRCVVRGSIRDYTLRDPGPADVALAVEVAESSLSEDRKQASIYAKGGIPFYWIVDLINRQVEVYSGPTANGYALREIYLAGHLVPVFIEGVEVGQIAVDAVLP
jgi:Uma2 family endonuclease